MQRFSPVGGKLPPPVHACARKLALHSTAQQFLSARRRNSYAGNLIPHAFRILLRRWAEAWNEHTAGAVALKEVKQ